MIYVICMMEICGELETVCNDKLHRLISHKNLLIAKFEIKI